MTVGRPDYKICKTLCGDDYFIRTDNELNRARLEELKARRGLVMKSIPVLSRLLEEGRRRDREYNFHFFENKPLIDVLRDERNDAKNKIKSISEELQSAMDEITPVEIKLEDLEKELTEKQGSGKVAVEDEIAALKAELKEMRKTAGKLNLSLRDLQETVESSNEVLNSYNSFAGMSVTDPDRPKSHGEIDFRRELQEMIDQLSEVVDSERLRELGEAVNIELRTSILKKREKRKEKEKMSMSLLSRVATYFSSDEEIEEVKLPESEIIVLEDLKNQTFELKDLLGDRKVSGFVKRAEGNLKRNSQAPVAGFLLRKRKNELMAYAKRLIDLVSVNSQNFLVLLKDVQDLKAELKNLFFEIAKFQERVATPIDIRLGKLIEKFKSIKGQGGSTIELRGELNSEWFHVVRMIVSRRVDEALREKKSSLGFTGWESNFIRFGFLSPEIFGNPLLQTMVESNFSGHEIIHDFPGIDNISVHYLDEEIERWFLTQDIYEGWSESRGDTSAKVWVIKPVKLSPFRKELMEYKKIMSLADVCDSIAGLAKAQIIWNLFGWLEDLLGRIRTMEELLKISSGDDGEIKLLNERRQNYFTIVEGCLSNFLAQRKTGAFQSIPPIVGHLANYLSHHRQELELGDKTSESYMSVRIGKGSVFDAIVEELSRERCALSDRIDKGLVGMNELKPLAFAVKNIGNLQTSVSVLERAVSMKASIFSEASGKATTIQNSWFEPTEVRSSVLNQLESLSNFLGGNDSFIPFDESIASCDSEFSLSKLSQNLSAFVNTVDPLMFSQIPQDSPALMSENKSFFPTFVNFKRKETISLPKSLSDIGKKLVPFYRRAFSQTDRLDSLCRISDIEAISGAFDTVLDLVLKALAGIESPMIVEASQKFLALDHDTAGQGIHTKLSRLESCLGALMEARLGALCEFYMYNKGSETSSTSVSIKKKNLSNAELALSLPTHKKIAIEKLTDIFPDKLESVYPVSAFFRNRCMNASAALIELLDEYRRGVIDKSTFKRQRDSVLGVLFEAAHHFRHFSEKHSKDAYLTSHIAPMAFALEELAKSFYEQFNSLFSEGMPQQQCAAGAPTVTALRDSLKECMTAVRSFREGINLAEIADSSSEKLVGNLKNLFYKIFSSFGGKKKVRKPEILAEDFSELVKICTTKAAAVAAGNCSELKNSSRDLVGFSQAVYLTNFSSSYVVTPASEPECLPPNFIIMPGNLTVAGFYPPEDINDEDMRKTSQYHEFIRDPENGNIIKIPMFPPKNIVDYLITPLYNFRIFCDKQTITFRDNQGFMYKKFPRNLWHEKITALKSGTIVHKLLKIHYFSFGKTLTKVFTKENTVLPVKGKLEKPVINPKKIDEVKDFFDYITGLTDSKGSSVSSKIFSEFLTFKG